MDSQIRNLEKCRDSLKDARLKVRVIALLMLACGLSPEVVSLIAGKTEKTVENWFRQYLTEGGAASPGEVSLGAIFCRTALCEKRKAKDRAPLVFRTPGCSGTSGRSAKDKRSDLLRCGIMQKVKSER